MKKIIVFLTIGLSLIFATDRAKLDLLTNFNNFKKYQIEFDVEEFKRDKFRIGKEYITNGKATFTIEAILFNGDEGKLEDLNKSEIEALPDTPYKFCQQMQYAWHYATDFDRDMAFLYHSGKSKDIAREISYGENGQKLHEIDRNHYFKKILMGVRMKDRVVVVYERHIKKKDGTIYTKPMYRYDLRGITKENGKWVMIQTIPTPDISMAFRWCWIAYEKQRSGRSGGGGDINSTFFSAFKEVEK